MEKESSRKLAVVILAAGKGKRMKNPELPKVLIKMAGKPLLGHVLDQAVQLEPESIVIVVGHFREKVEEYIESLGLDNTVLALQAEQLGTGHAVAQAESALSGFSGHVLILCGDVPLLSVETLNEFVEQHFDNEADLSVLSADAPDPTGYGRIVRNGNGEFLKITEEKDANEEEKKITEFNSGVFIVESGMLFDSLKHVSNNNSQGEYYLTDIVGILHSRGRRLIAHKGADFDELQGVNSPEQLAKAEKFFHDFRS